MLVQLSLLFNFEWPIGRELRIDHLKRETPNGGVAQLGEHLPCKQGVMGSIPIISTSDEGHKRVERDEMHRKLTWAHSSGG